MAIGAISALLGVLYALAEQESNGCWPGVPSKTSALFCWRWCGDGRSVTARPAAHRCWTAGALFHLLNHALFKGLLFLGAVRLFRVCIPTTWKKWGHWRTYAVDSRSMPDWLPRDISYSPLNGFISEWYTWQSLFSLSRWKP